MRLRRGRSGNRDAKFTCAWNNDLITRIVVGQSAVAAFGFTHLKQLADRTAKQQPSKYEMDLHQPDHPHLLHQSPEYSRWLTGLLKSVGLNKRLFRQTKDTVNYCVLIKKLLELMAVSSYSWKKHTNVRRDKAVKISYLSSSSHYYIYCSSTKVVFGVAALYVVGVVAVVVLAVNSFSFSSPCFWCSCCSRGWRCSCRFCC